MLKTMTIKEISTKELVSPEEKKGYNVKLTDAEHEKLKTLAKHYKLTMSSVVQQLINNYTIPEPEEPNTENKEVIAND